MADVYTTPLCWTMLSYQGTNLVDKIHRATHLGKAEVEIVSCLYRVNSYLFMKIAAKALGTSLCPWLNLLIHHNSSLDMTQLCCCCSVAKLHPTLCDLMDCSTPGFPGIYHLLELAQTHVHWVGDSIQPSRPLLSPSPAFCLSQHQGLFQWVGSSHQVAKVLEFQLQHQSFQWIFRFDFL